jgi:hypothetical protein
MRAGFLYVFSNRSYPQLLKVGSTHLHPVERAKELSTTGVPFPFQVEHYAEVADHHQAERQLHQLLRAERVRKEFFRLPVSRAVEVVDMVARRFPIVEVARHHLMEGLGQLLRAYLVTLPGACPLCGAAVGKLQDVLQDPRYSPGGPYEGTLFTAECRRCGSPLYAKANSFKDPTRPTPSGLASEDIRWFDHYGVLASELLWSSRRNAHVRPLSHDELTEILYLLF